MNISIIGYGSWGQALSFVCSKLFDSVLVWHYREVKPHIKNVKATDSWEELFAAHYIIYALPTSYLEDILIKVKKNSVKQTVFINSSKGLSRTGLKLPYEIFKESGIHKDYISLSGPSFSKGLLNQDPTALIAASDNKKTFEIFKSFFATSNVKLFYSNDIIGTEWGGIFKNIVSILVGISDGIGYGVNTRALFITKGLLEMCKTGERLGAQKETFSTFSGIGDIVLSTSDLDGRNYSLGLLVGRGKTADEALKEIQGTVEGFHTLTTIQKINHSFLQAPLLNVLNKIFFQKIDAKVAFSDYLDSL
jgi:glycerol-3-phosphate dehydrogenase (NAD(P)+)